MTFFDICVSSIILLPCAVELGMGGDILISQNCLCKNVHSGNCRSQKSMTDKQVRFAYFE